MSYPTREDGVSEHDYRLEGIPPGWKLVDAEPKPRLDWSQVIAIGILLGALVGLLAWWIWR